MPEAEELSVRPATHARTQMHSKCLAAACPHAQSSALALPKLQRALRPGVAPHAARRFSPQSCRADGSAPRALTQHTFPEPSGRNAPSFLPPTHNREPYDTQLSDTISTDPPVEPMPLSSTRFMRMSVCGVRAPSHGPRTVRAGARLRAVGHIPSATCERASRPRGATLRALGHRNAAPSVSSKQRAAAPACRRTNGRLPRCRTCCPARHGWSN